MARLDLIKAAFFRQRSLYLTWILSLALAVTGLVIIDVYRQSLDTMIRTQGRKILTADITMSARRSLTEDEKKLFRSLLPTATKFSELTEMMAMVSSGNNTRLANLRFVDVNHPLIGDLQTDNPSALLGPTEEVWVANDLLTLLPATLGDILKVGNLKLKISGIVRKDSSQTFRFGTLAPRLYLHKDHLQPSRLLQFGSTFTQMILARTERPITQKERAKIEKNFADPGLQIMVPEDLEQGSLRVLARLLDFLGLIGLVTLCLGWLGVYYLGRRWLVLERKSTAALKGLGLSSADIQQLLLMKLLLILLLGSTLGGGLSWWGAKTIFPLLKNSLPTEFELVWSWPSTLLVVLIGPLAGTLLLFEPINRTAHESPVLLFNPELSQLKPNRRMITGLAFGTALLFGFLTLLQARSWQVSGFFLATLLTTMAVVSGLTWLALRGLRTKRLKLSGWAMHLATGQWLRRPATTILLVSVSALSGLMAQLIPHLEKTFVSELTPAKADQRPALFLFDIQDEQKQPLIEFLNQKGVKLSQEAPFIRARILKVNDENFERGQASKWSTREEELEARFRNRGVNLTYRKSLSPHERILSGRPWPETKEDEISVERDYASRLKLKVGDRLVFDVQGTEVAAKIASLREVHWDRFEPAFFIQFTEGALNDAPKTWVMTVRRSLQYSTSEVQRLISREFPNISSVHIEEAVENLSDLVSKLALGLKLASRLAMGLGAFVFVMVLTLQLLSSEADASLLRAQGIDSFDLWRLNVLNFGSLAATGLLLGGLLSMAVNWGLAHFAFRSTPEFDFGAMLQTAATLAVVCLLSLTWAGRRARGLIKN